MKALGRLGILCALCALALAVGVTPALALTETDSVGRVPRALTGGETALSGESSLGSATADALRYVSGADVAIVNGGDLGWGLEVGEQNYGAVQEAYAHDRDLAVVVVTPRELAEMLEAGVSRIIVNRETSVLEHEQSQFEGFPQVSGLWFQYDAAGPAGDRIMRVRLDDGGALDLEDDTTTITLAATAFMLSGGYGYPEISGVQELDHTLSTAMAEYVASGEGDKMGEGSRMSVAGSQENAIIAVLPGWFFPVVVAALVIGGAAGGTRRYKRLNPDRAYQPSGDR